VEPVRPVNTIITECRDSTSAQLTIVQILTMLSLSGTYQCYTLSPFVEIKIQYVLYKICRYINLNDALVTGSEWRAS